MASAILILANIRDVQDLPDQEAICKNLESRLQDEYNEISFDPEAYIQSLDNIVFGSKNTESILRIANGWNDCIVRNLQQAITSWQTGGSKPEHQTYELVKAAMAADNTVHPYATRLLYNMYKVHNDDTDYTFSTVLSPEHLAHIQQHPDQYALIEVSVK